RMVYMVLFSLHDGSAYSSRTAQEMDIADVVAEIKAAVTGGGRITLDDDYASVSVDINEHSDASVKYYWSVEPDRNRFGTFGSEHMRAWELDLKIMNSFMVDLERELMRVGIHDYTWTEPEEFDLFGDDEGVFEYRPRCVRREDYDFAFAVQQHFPYYNIGNPQFNKWLEVSHVNDVEGLLGSGHICFYCIDGMLQESLVSNESIMEAATSGKSIWAWIAEWPSDDVRDCYIDAFRVWVEEIVPRLLSRMPDGPKKGAVVLLKKRCDAVDTFDQIDQTLRDRVNNLVTSIVSDPPSALSSAMA
ncbi:MAG: hypothetical protein WA003_04400, partial [Desulfuromonadaceae bacterium]